MPSLLDLRRRIRAVKSTQQITKAMKMIAASRLRKAQDRILNARPYAEQMLRVLNSLVARVDPTVRLKVHDGVRLAVNPERLHFFDTTNEKAI